VETSTDTTPATAAPAGAFRADQPLRAGDATRDLLGLHSAPPVALRIACRKPAVSAHGLSGPACTQGASQRRP
jgi:hypothetical protein